MAQATPDSRSLVSGSARTRQMVMAALLAAMIAGTSWISVPFGPVPVTLQTVFVLLAALLLTPGWAAVSMVLYLALGAVGVPVFAQGASGFGALFGPTGGFLVAFPVAAAAASAIYRAIAGRDDDRFRSIAAAIMAVLAAEIVIYAIGLPWLMSQTGLPLGKAVAVALLPFVAPDAVKAFFAVVLAEATRKSLRA